MDISADPSHRRTADPEPGLRHHHGPAGSTVHLDQYGPSSPGSCMGLEHKHGFRALTISQASTLVSVVMEAMNINSDPGCYGAADPDMVLRLQPCPG